MTKEVPAPLTEAQAAAIDFYSRFTNATELNVDNLLYKVDSIRVHVSLNDGVKKVISEERIRDKFELTLRKYNIRLDDGSPDMLLVDCTGKWNENEHTITYFWNTSFMEIATVNRKEELRRAPASVWFRSDGIGFAGSLVAEKQILEEAEERAERFANAYLKAQEKTK